MITTNDTGVYEKARYLRDHAMSSKTRYWHTEIGYNYRITNIQAALGLAQLEQIDDFIGQRNELLGLYRQALEPHGIECNPRIGAAPVNWISCAVVDGLPREQRDAVIAGMRERGVDTRPFFFPISMFPMYASGGRAGGTPVAHLLSQSGFNLPTFIDITEDQVAQVCSVFLGTLKAALVAIR